MKTATVFKKRWDAEEIDILRNVYPLTPTCDDFQECHMPYRTTNQIYKKAVRLNVHKGRKWEQLSTFSDVSEKELAYFAGILDGEGYICTDSSRGISIQVVNTDHNLVLWLRTKFGGSLTEREGELPHHKRQYHWTLTRKEKVIRILSLVSDLLIVKKEKADYLLDLYKYEGDNHGKC
jgi:hypothetical protein